MAESFDDLDALKRDLDKTLVALEDARSRLAREQRNVMIAEERAQAMRRLVALYGAEQGNDLGPKGKPLDIVDAVVELINDNGAPMRLSEIRERLLERGIPLPGKGADANLFGSLKRSGGRVVRIERGLYATAPNHGKR